MPKVAQVHTYLAIAVPKCTFRIHINTVLTPDSLPNCQVQLTKIYKSGESSANIQMRPARMMQVRFMHSASHKDKGITGVVCPNTCR